jgi:hypothetical protein
MIHERREGGLVERHDLFTNLLESNNMDEGPNVLMERELVGATPLPSFTSSANDNPLC